jgi:hypothetical protein
MKMETEYNIQHLIMLIDNVVLEYNMSLDDTND